MSNDILQYTKMTPDKLLQSLEITQAPVNLNIIAEKMGVKIKRNADWDKLGYDGEIYLDENNHPEIWISPTIHANRQNFTLAHEIGHLVLDVLPNIDNFRDPIKDDYSTMRRDGSKNSIEIRANNFAARLLMPKSFIYDSGAKIVEEYQKEFGPNAKLKIDDFIEKIAQIFQVSKDAMKYRLMNLGIIQRN